MSRRFQFSLRALLVATAAVCLMFGGLRLLKQSEFLELRLVKRGHQGVKARGRFVRLLGAPDVGYWVEFQDQDRYNSNSLPCVILSGMFTASRSWFAIYDFKTVFDPPKEPGRYEYTIVVDGQPGPRTILSVK